MSEDVRCVDWGGVPSQGRPPQLQSGEESKKHIQDTQPKRLSKVIDKCRPMAHWNVQTSREEVTYDPEYQAQTDGANSAQNCTSCVCFKMTISVIQSFNGTYV